MGRSTVKTSARENALIVEPDKVKPPPKRSLCLSQLHGKSGVCEWHSWGIWNLDKVRAIQDQCQLPRVLFSIAHGTWDGTGRDEGRVQTLNRPCVIVFINLAMTFSSTFSFDNICEEGGWLPTTRNMANHESLLPVLTAPSTQVALAMSSLLGSSWLTSRFGQQET